MSSRSLALVACGLLCSACVGTNPYYVDPTTATTTTGQWTTTTGEGTTATVETGETEAEASTQAETTSPTATTASEPWCGDGNVDDGEDCDEGPDNGDSDCNSSCEFAVCGDGEVAPWEECDDGQENGSPDSACTFFCEEAVCGDGELSLGEECDDGENNVDGDGFTCHSDCTEDYCGDTYLSPEEQCDPKINDGGHCDLMTCELKYCGDGIVEDSFEQCDVLNNDPNCLPNCMYPPSSLGWGGGEVEGGLVGQAVGEELKINCNTTAPVGLFGKIDLVTLWLGQVGALCGERTLVKLGTHAYTVMHGNFVGSVPAGMTPDSYDEGMTQCAGNEVLIGLAGTGEDYLTSVSPICMKVEIFAVMGKWKPVFHFPVVAPPLGDDGGMAGTKAVCPPGHGVSRLSAYVGDAGVTGVEIYCKMFTLP